MKPLQPRRDTQAAAQKFHRDVFAMFGGKAKLCVFCGGQGATDAAHVIPRSKLGHLRYADPRLARPAHRHCHEAQTRNETDFSLDVRRAAIRAHNEIAKQKLEEPTE